MARDREPICIVLRALVAVALITTRAPAQEPEERGPASGILERLDAAERAREKACAESEAQEEAERARRERETSDAHQRREQAAAEAARAFERRRGAMREWHASFDAVLSPVLATRQRLYQRMPHRMFARVREQCE